MTIYPTIEHTGLDDNVITRLITRGLTRGSPQQYQEPVKSNTH